MLTGDFDDLQINLPRLYPLVRSFSAGHISRFPMTFARANMSVHFFDSRFDKVVAKLYIDDMKYKLYSENVKNNKYSESSTGYHTRSTSNMKVMVEYLQSYVKLIAAERIWDITFNQAKSLHGEWRNAFSDAGSSLELDGYGSNVSNLRAALAKDLRNYIFSGGIPYSHPELAKFKTKEFMDAWTEHERRKAIEKPRTNVYINPDNTVVVKHSDGTMTTHNSINELNEDIRSKMALLKMLENHSIIGEVGIKINSCNFWLY